MRLLGNLGIQSITLFPAEELRFDGEGYLVLMLQEGQAYWLEAEASAMVERGQLLVVPRGGDRCLRGGRFEESVLIGFSICLRILEGVLALRERREIETWLAASKLPLILPKDHAAARLLGSVSFNSESSDLLVRAKALEVVGLVFGDALENENEAFALRGTSSCEARMRRFMDMVTIGELEGVSIELLANTCGCSPRHANRVFRRCFGGSLHDTQAEIQQKRNSVFPLVEFL